MARCLLALGNTPNPQPQCCPTHDKTVLHKLCRDLITLFPSSRRHWKSSSLDLRVVVLIDTIGGRWVLTAVTTMAATSTAVFAVATRCSGRKRVNENRCNHVVAVHLDWPSATSPCKHSSPPRLNGKPEDSDEVPQ